MHEQSATATSVQFGRYRSRGKAWRSVSPAPNSKRPPVVAKISIELAGDDLDFLHHYAEFQNAGAKATLRKGEEVKSWSRKSLIEMEMTYRTDALRLELAEVFAEVGPWPSRTSFAEGDEGDEDWDAAMLDYAKRVAAWDARQPEPTTCECCGQPVSAATAQPKKSKPKK